MFAYSLGDGTEDDTFLGEFLLEGSLDRHRVHDGIDSCTRQGKAILERNTQFVESLHEFGVNLLILAILRLCRRVGIVGNSLIVDGRQGDMSPRRLLPGLPVAICLKTEIEKPFGFSFLLGDEPYDILVKSLLDDFGMYVGSKTEFVFLLYY